MFPLARVVGTGQTVEPSLYAMQCLLNCRFLASASESMNTLTSSLRSHPSQPCLASATINHHFDIRLQKLVLTTPSPRLALPSGSVPVLGPASSSMVQRLHPKQSTVSHFDCCPNVQKTGNNSFSSIRGWNVGSGIPRVFVWIRYVEESSYSSAVWLLIRLVLP